MIFDFFRAKGTNVLKEIENKMQRMVEYSRFEFDLAMSALLGDAVAAEVRPDLRATDQKVNQLEREIRRALLVNASVFGGIESPSVLMYMSVVKDVERVGDYAKNLIDLGMDGASFADIPDSAEWRRLSTEISQFIQDAGTAFKDRDTKAAEGLHERGDALLRLFDERVSELVKEVNPEHEAVARALAYRYFKRVVAHLMNLLSALIMPMDQLGYFDEDPEDRAH